MGKAGSSEPAFPDGKGRLKRAGLSTSGSCGRQSKEKCGAFAGTRLRPDSATVRFDNSLRNRETETGALAVGSARLPESIERVGQLLGCHPVAGVPDRKNKL